MTPLAPQTDPGKGKSLLLAAAVHLALIGALVFGVQWKSRSPEAVEVEVWRSAPAAASTPPEPAPKPEPKPEAKPEPKPEPRVEPKPPVKPDIAVKEEKKKPEPKKPEPKPEPKKPEPERRLDFGDQLKRDTKQLETKKALQDTQARADQEARQLSQLKADQASAARTRGLADYASKIRGKIRGNIVLPPVIQGNPEAGFEVTQLPSGEVISVKLKKSSGNPSLDAAIERAILKSSPLPKPDQPELFQRTLELKYKPFDE